MNTSDAFLPVMIQKETVMKKETLYSVIRTTVLFPFVLLATNTLCSYLVKSIIRMGAKGFQYFTLLLSKLKRMIL